MNEDILSGGSGVSSESPKRHSFFDKLATRWEQTRWKTGPEVLQVSELQLGVNINS